jgi:hypothetical protein
MTIECANYQRRRLIARRNSSTSGPTVVSVRGRSNASSHWRSHGGQDHLLAVRFEVFVRLSESSVIRDSLPLRLGGTAGRPAVRELWERAAGQHSGSAVIRMIVPPRRSGRPPNGSEGRDHDTPSERQSLSSATICHITATSVESYGEHRAEWRLMQDL